MASEWPEIQLGELVKRGEVTLQTGPFGSQLHKHDYIEHGVPVVPTEAIGRGLIVSESVLPQITEKKATELKRHALQRGDILFARRGAQATGLSAYVDDAHVGALCGTGAILLRLRSAALDPKFIASFLATNEAFEWLRANAVGAVMPNLNTGIISQLVVPVPPLWVQREIGITSSVIENRIQLLRNQNMTLEAIAQTLFKSWFVDFDPVRAKAEGREPDSMDAATAALFPDSFEDSPLGPIPQGWRIDEIGNVVNCIGGATPSTKELSFWEPAEHHWVTPKDLSGLAAPVLMDTNRKVSTAGLKKISSGTLPKGTLLLSSRAPIGYLAIAQIPTAINQGFIAMPPGGELPPIYLLFWTQWNMDSIKQKANGSTFMEISKFAFRPIKLCVPPEEIVTAFVSIAEPLLERIAANEAQRTQLAQLRDTLLPRLISGKLRLPDAQALIEDATP